MKGFITLVGLSVFLLAAAPSAAINAPPAPPSPIGFTIRGVDDAMDLHGDPASADLVIFAAGNQWMVLPDLLAAFQKLHPDVKHVFYETLPPGILAEQMSAGAPLRMGELLVDSHPDVYLAGQRRMAKERVAGLVGDPVAYATNDLALMVRAGNPKHIESLRDLARSDVRIAMPNPQTEGIAKQIERAYANAGGRELVDAVMNAKLRDGTTMLTRIHHRETPIWILDGKADAGPVWISEALYQERIHSGIEAVRIPAKLNVTAIYEGAVVTNAAHAASAKEFVDFLTSDTAQAIYRSYGFTAAPQNKE